MDGHMDASLWPSNSWRWVELWLNQGNNWVQTLPLCQGRVQEPLHNEFHIYLIYINKVFKNLLMQWMAIWMQPYGHQSHGGGLKWLNQGNNWVQILPLCQGRGQEPLQT